MAKRTQLYDYHKQYAKLMEFGGFDMPLWYKGIVDEHNAVRNSAGIFDVSHMGRFSITGEDSASFLNHILPSDVSKIKDHRAFYSTLCNDSAGIVDDTVTNKSSERNYTMVVNASNREKDWTWLDNRRANYSIEITDISDETALLAFQGPLAAELMQKVADHDLSEIRRFALMECKIDGVSCVVSRTGYTGEDGFEITVLNASTEESNNAEKIWKKLLDLGRSHGVLPCGLGARDSLRLEAGMCLYGNDIDETTTPVEAGLSSIVSTEKHEDYPGRHLIEDQIRNGSSRKRVAFSIQGGGIPRHGYEIQLAGTNIGLVTSGTFSPTLKIGIGMGYVPKSLSDIGQNFSIKAKNNELMARVVATPFYDKTKFGFSRNMPKSE
jgi:aminomethyltransferase